MCVLLHYQGAEDTVEYWKEKASSLTVDRDAEREERNYFQLERDKINTFWEISKKELEDRKAELRNKDREMEELEERHQVEIKVYKQKVKHLLYEHQNNVSQLKEEQVRAQLCTYRPAMPQQAASRPYSQQCRSKQQGSTYNQRKQGKASCRGNPTL